MATVNPITPPPSVVNRTGSRRSWRRLVIAGVILAGLLSYFWKPINGYAQVGAAYGARVGCSCHYLGGRGLSDCTKDFESGMELITLRADEAAKSVTARFPLLARQTATFREGEGCRLEPWQD